MPKSPQKWPFPNRTILGLGMDTSVYDYSSQWSRLLNRHGCVVYPCKSCFDPANGHGRVTLPCEEVHVTPLTHIYYQDRVRGITRTLHLNILNRLTRFSSDLKLSGIHILSLKWAFKALNIHRDSSG